MWTPGLVQSNLQLQTTQICSKSVTMFTKRKGYVYCVLIVLASISLVYAETHGAGESANEPMQKEAAAYVLSNTKSDWSEALNTCHHTGGRLASPMNPKIQASIRIFLTGQSIGENEKVWTSGRAWRGEWRWYLPNVPIIYQNFLDAPCAVPMEGHAISMMRSVSGVTWEWCKEPEESQLRFLCEYGSVPTTSTMSSLTGSYDSSTGPTEGSPGGSARGDGSVLALTSLLVLWIIRTLNIL